MIAFLWQLPSHAIALLIFCWRIFRPAILALRLVLHLRSGAEYVISLLRHWALHTPNTFSVVANLNVVSIHIIIVALNFTNLKLYQDNTLLLLNFAILL